MRKYIIVVDSKIIDRGESEFYADFESLVPAGYKYVWAFNSREIMIINVVHTDSLALRPCKHGKDAVNMVEWTKARRDYYSMTF